jgi:acetyl esterase
MSRHRIADLQLRGSTSPLPVRVYWPGQATSQPVPVLVLCIVGAGAGAQAEQTCRGLSEDYGLLVLGVRCLAGAHDGMTVLEWAAEHAAELSADPARLVVAGQGAGGAVATAVISQAQASGWPEAALASGPDLSEAVRQILARAASNSGGQDRLPGE